LKLTILLTALALPLAASTITSAGISGLGTTTISGTAQADCYSGCLASVYVSTLVTATTLGPVREGFISLSVFGGTGGLADTWGRVGGYLFRCLETCFGNLVNQPFTLGVPFDISFGARADPTQSPSGSAALLTFQFSLFDSIIVPVGPPWPGQSVVVDVAPTHSPEPAAWLLTAAGIGLLLWRRIGAA